MRETKNLYFFISFYLSKNIKKLLKNIIIQKNKKLEFCVNFSVLNNVIT